MMQLIFQLKKVIMEKKIKYDLLIKEKK
jgi:hypothetical protein